MPLPPRESRRLDERQREAMRHFNASHATAAAERSERLFKTRQSSLHGTSQTCRVGPVEQSLMWASLAVGSKARIISSLH